MYIVIQIGGADPLRDEAFAYAEKLMGAGCRVTVIAYAGLPHGFYMFPQLKQSKQYLEEVVEFVNSLRVRGKLARL